MASRSSPRTSVLPRNFTSPTPCRPTVNSGTRSRYDRSSRAAAARSCTVCNSRPVQSSPVQSMPVQMLEFQNPDPPKEAGCSPVQSSPLESTFSLVNVSRRERKQQGRAPVVCARVERALSRAVESEEYQRGGGEGGTDLDGGLDVVLRALEAGKVLL
eukprot:713116-Prorocentrum_minimum.AAC.2